MKSGRADSRAMEALAYRQAVGCRVSVVAWGTSADEEGLREMLGRVADASPDELAERIEAAEAVAGVARVFLTFALGGRPPAVMLVGSCGLRRGYLLEGAPLRSVEDKRVTAIIEAFSNEVTGELGNVPWIEEGGAA